ncbi:intraflagellar transport-associated protein [Hyperolius riggenbachi]|uniref:intraflagellar transport-associated protein n=1 Tax=Hyperolius riggenbachi TaxID=752182 RepID=UPI0035A38FCD
MSRDFLSVVLYDPDRGAWQTVHRRPGAYTMPSPCDRSSEVTEDNMVSTVLNRFLNIREQTYDDFLATFTSIPQDRRVCESPRTQNHRPASDNTDNTQRSEEAVLPVGMEEAEQLVIDDGVTVGCCHSLSHSGRVQVDNFLNSSDVNSDSEEEETGQNYLLYPGEADPGPGIRDKPVVRDTCLEIRTSSMLEPCTEERLCDDVQPFSLDPSFDYDRVTLTPKFSAAELDFLNGRTQRTAETGD